MDHCRFPVGQEEKPHWVSEQTGKTEAGLLGKAKSLPLFLRLHVNLTCSFLLASPIRLVAEGFCPAFCSHWDTGSITKPTPYSVPDQCSFVRMIPVDNSSFTPLQPSYVSSFRCLCSVTVLQRVRDLLSQILVQQIKKNNNNW